jgi:hypothetical protein
MPGKAVIDTKMTSFAQHFHFYYVYSLTRGGVLRIYEYSSYTYISYFFIFPFSLGLYYIIRLSRLFGVCQLLASHLLTRS